jgi:glycosyltransferase involved in cell wall biosynthesis
MRVGISLLTLVPGEVGGSETYARGLCRGLAEVGTLEYTVFTPPTARGAGEGLPETPVPEYRTARSMPQRAVAMALAALRPARIRSRLAGVDVLHYALTVAVPKVDAPRVVTLFDLQHLDLPELFGRAERAYRRLAYEGAVRTADAVVVNSQFVRRSVIERLGVPPERIHTIPLGIDHDRFTPGHEEREQFLLYPARPWPHKNHERLFEAFAILRRERPDLELVLTGGGHEGRAVPEGVVVRGLISGEELVSLYRRAACLVFPSLYEGFGQPPLEAMACGCPVAASNIPAIAEACGDAAALFDPSDPEDIAAVVAAVLDAPDRFAAAGLARARAFTWPETARRHEDVYRLVGQLIG